MRHDPRKCSTALQYWTQQELLLLEYVSILRSNIEHFLVNDISCKGLLGNITKILLQLTPKVIYWEPSVFLREF